MGVPAFYRWLSRKYPSIVVDCVEEQPRQLNTTVLPIDATQPNPNGVEFDNLYLDLNCIVHPCCHPDDRPAYKTEEDMMEAIFTYVDRLFNIVRPRKLLYLAVDGVAPRAKMNQQRSRRFRSVQDHAEKAEQIEKKRMELQEKGMPVPEKKDPNEQFDSNCITPGTEFMEMLAQSLNYYVHVRMNTDPAWAKIQVILSDANAPGEGEHKIMDFIRRQRASPGHDPNTHHCLCGADADLIMLGLATHEPHFTIIREEFNPHRQRPCELCAQYGHNLDDCQGLGDGVQEQTEVAKVRNFIFLRLSVLREYLEREMRDLPFEFDLERAIDDWVFLCFFVGNDFLPHLPSLMIRENAIDRLITIYKSCAYKIGGYLTNNGKVNLERTQVILSELGEMEDQIFRTRQRKELEFQARRKRQDEMNRRRNQKFTNQVQNNHWRPTTVDNVKPVTNPRFEAFNIRKQEQNQSQEQEDEVRLHEDGWKERYYQAKFRMSARSVDFRRRVARAYVEGLCWVLGYYYQNCPSWQWYYPFHYAPFASDFINITSMPLDFESAAQPFHPMEQLMAVFPAASRKHLPAAWQNLMADPDSPIIDFYPEDFKVDLNGKKFAWQGVALLPFVEENRLLETLEEVYNLLTDREKERNTRGTDRLFVGPRHQAFGFLRPIYDVSSPRWVDIEPTLTYGMSGSVNADKCGVMPGGTFKSPLTQRFAHITNNQVLCVQFANPHLHKAYVFSSRRLLGAQDPPKVLKPIDWNERNEGKYKPTIGFNYDRMAARLADSGHRMLATNMSRQQRNYNHNWQQPAPARQNRNQHPQEWIAKSRHQYEPYPRPPPSNWNKFEQNQAWCQNNNFAPFLPPPRPQGFYHRPPFNYSY